MKKLESRQLKLSLVATENQVADCLTKRLSSIDQVMLCDKMSLIDIFVHFERECCNITSIYEYQLEILIYSFFIILHYTSI
jgi:hypothetical protein